MGPQHLRDRPAVVPAGRGLSNYAAHDVPASRAQTMFGEDRWARLRQVKQTYDPTNLLRYNANITP
jgi:FAD/FMN-containing dehydrogenase